MGFLPPTKICIIFLIISASLIASSNAGRESKLMSKSLADEEFVGAYEESPFEGEDKEESITVHERMLRRMNTHDYGRYDPSPHFARPRHKLIPN